ncbi:hypothetical protein DNTS_001728 [Danionella cerebrum]|uniref:Uncharacterized protein n=1 Tax=Danionella cerebrum TaxID=2873325 RepID=A0A553QUX7_9TELE|nr:hypothetical protein DNTS_001728 [Danionella translucida]
MLLSERAAAAMALVGCCCIKLDDDVHAGPVCPAEERCEMNGCPQQVPGQSDTSTPLQYVDPVLRSVRDSMLMEEELSDLPLLTTIDASINRLLREAEETAPSIKPTQEPETLDPIDA